MAEPINIAVCRALLGEIVVESSRVSYLAGLAMEKSGDGTAVDVIGNTIQTVSSRIAWLGETLAAHMGLDAVSVGDDARDWLLPASVSIQDLEGHSHG